MTDLLIKEWKYGIQIRSKQHTDFWKLRKNSKNKVNSISKKQKCKKQKAMQNFNNTDELRQKKR